VYLTASASNVVEDVLAGTKAVGAGAQVDATKVEGVEPRVDGVPVQSWTDGALRRLRVNDALGMRPVLLARELQRAGDVTWTPTL
jgi:hypothetical protein